jgi:predicted permease
MADRLALRCTRRLARVLLRLYPRAFRRRWANDFVEAAAHRCRRELTAAAGPAPIAAVRTWLLLCADTLGAAPTAWRSTGSNGVPSGSDLPPSIREHLMTSIAGTFSDLRTALRLMQRQPGTSALVVATLALGIGVSAAAFAALDRVVLNPLPFAHGDRMRYLALEHRVLGWRITPEGDTLPRWRAGAKTLERIETYRDASATLVGGAGPERLGVLMISTGLPGMLGVRPAAGRMLVEADAAPDAPAAVMLHETYWRRKLGADPGIVGRDLRLSTGPAAVVGIWPAGARLNQRTPPDLVRIMRRDQEIVEGGWTSVLAVVRAGVGDDAVAGELGALLPKNADGRNEVGADFAAVVVPPTGFVSDAYVQGLWLVFGAALALLVVAILNAANLLLGRATTRSAELGVRLALGGSHGRILRLLGAESVVLTTAGAALGFGIAWLTERVYAAWAPAGLAAPEGAWLARRTIAFAAGAAAAATLAGALIPAWRARAASVREVLAGAGLRTTDGSSRLRAALVAAQAALAVLLVVGASITGRSFLQLASVHPGFDVDPLAVVSVSAPASRYKTPEAQAAFLRQVRDAIAALPQVERFTITNAPPFSTSTSASLPFFEGEPEPVRAGTAEVRSQSVDAEYFAVFGTPIVAGRLFAPADGRNAVIVNESFARAHGGDVLGRRLRFTGRSATWYSVVGVAGDVTAGPLADGAAKDPQLYFPRQAGDERTFARFVMRVRGDPAAAIAAVRARVAVVDPLTPLAEARTVREIFDGQTSRHRFVAYLLGGLALFGVVFAVSGVYGVVSLEVARRRREVGVRVALGATAASIVGQMTRRGLRPVAVGAALGVAAALALGPLLKDLLFRVSERDPWSAAAGVGVVLATALVGCALPARRAAQVDPVVALRDDQG